MTPVPALALLIAQAPAHDAVLVRSDCHSAGFRLTVTLLDGRQIERRVEVRLYGLEPTVREPSPHDLPAFCPERHVNEDGTFCLGWSEHEPKEIVDEASAILWWGKLIQFFRLQERATRHRRWPDRRAWAHGAAARFQKAAEESAAVLGPRFTTALEWGRLTLSKPVRRSARFRGAYSLLLDGVPVLRAWRDADQLVNMRQACACDARVGRKPVAMRGCADHAAQAVALVRALAGWRDAEQRFWASFAGKTCCGTLDDCPLKNASAAALPAASPRSTTQRKAA